MEGIAGVIIIRNFFIFSKFYPAERRSLRSEDLNFLFEIFRYFGDFFFQPKIVSKLLFDNKIINNIKVLTPLVRKSRIL